MVVQYAVCDPRLARWTPNWAGPLGVMTQSLMIVMEEGPSTLGCDQPKVYWELLREHMGLFLVGLRMVVWFTFMIVV